MTYDQIGITAATITISNNISYLTPNTLNRVDRPIGYFTGGLDVSGSLECYLNDVANGSSDLWKLLSQMTGSVNSFKIQLMIGGYYATSMVPGIVVHLPNAHLSVPELQTEDAMGLNIEFKGMGTDMSTGDEVRFCMAPNLNRTKIDQFLTTGFVTPV
ncbi:major tail protein [Aeromonas phage AhSzw-1]|uniref:Major tail protein n=1 Tax=Aeromonas phage AhSzw-1 TaxID=2138299 RepID=A0A2R4AM75_9CAUD|nr:major tail protein [Aeromonas phage AhSzw-1]AVR76159.1 major tail protein [Aeromonas phage AhSzw-1]